MKKIIVLLCLSFAFFVQNADAQTKKSGTKKPSSSKTAMAKSKKEPKEEVNFWKEKMMYGAFINYPFLGNGYFNMALSPFAGYKVNKFLTAGLLGKANYTWVRQGSGQAPLQILDLGGGVFSRVKIANVFFVHGELENTRYTASNLDKIKETSGRIGIGYASGFGTWRTELGVYYNALWKNTSLVQDTPFDFRLGLTYNF